MGDEDNEEEEEKKSEEAIKLEGKIANQQKFMDFFLMRLKKSNYKIKEAEICLKIMPDRKWCQRSKKFNDSKVSKYNEKLQKITNIMANLENDLQKLLTDKQKELRKEHEEEIAIERKIIRDEKYMELLESKQERNMRLRALRENIIANLTHKYDRVKSESRKERIKILIEKYEKLYEIRVETLE